MAREDLHFRLRIPDELKARVEASAVENHRSTTAEIVARLEESFEGNRRAGFVLEQLRGHLVRVIRIVIAETFPKAQKATVDKAMARIEPWLETLSPPKDNKS